MLAVDGKELLACDFGRGHDQFAGSYEHFLVRERHGAGKFDGFVGGFKPDDPDRCRDYDFGSRVGAHRKQAFAAVVDLGASRDRHAAEPRFQLGGSAGVGHRDKLRTMLFDLREELVEVGPRGERANGEAARQRFNHREALPADRAGGTQNGYVFHDSSGPD